MARKGETVAHEIDDTPDAEVSQTPPSDDLTFDEAIAEQEDAE